MRIHLEVSEWLKLKLLKPETLVIGIFLLALLFRLLYLHQIIPTPIFKGLAVDTEKFDSFALEILKGNFTHKDFISLNPLYPFFLAIFYLIFGHNHLPVILFQGIMDSISCIVIFYIATVLFNKRIGITSALIYACYGVAIFYTGILLATTLVIFLTLLFIASLLIADTTRRVMFFIVSGILFGLTVSARPNFIILLIFLPLWFFTELKNNLSVKKSLHRFLMFLIGFLSIVLLISFRNYSTVKEFTPSVVGGFNFYIGNNPNATGYYMFPLGRVVSPIEQLKTSVQHAEKESGQPLTYPQASRYWLRKGLEYINNNTGDTFWLYMKKLALFWRKEEISHQNIDYNMSKNYAQIFRLPFVSYGIIAPLSILGIVLAIIRKKNILLPIIVVISCMMSVIIFFMSVRYRLPAIPFLIIFASYALYRLMDMIRKKEIKNMCFWGALLVLLFAGINCNIEYFNYSQLAPKYYYLNLGKIYSKDGKLDAAIVEFKKSLSIDPKCIEAHYNLGYAYHQKGEFDRAISEYKLELANNPGYEKAHNNLGVVYTEQGKLDEAIYHYKQALAINSEYAIAHRNLGKAYYDKGEIDKATLEYKEAIALDPEDAMAHDRLGLIYAGEGQLDEAISEYERALAIDPHFAKAHNNLGSALLSKGKISEAVKHITESLRIDPDFANAQYNMGLALANQGQMDEAIHYFQEIIRNNPNFAEAHNNLGTLLAHKGQTDEAIHHFREALRIRPDYTKAKNNLEKILGSKNKGQ